MPEVCTSLPGQIGGRQLLANNVLCFYFAWHASMEQTCETHDSVIVLRKADDSWKENAAL